MDFFNDKSNVYYGHGTGADNYRVIESINNNGLRFSHEQLSFTTVPFGNGSTNLLNEIGKKGQNWEHNNSKYIVIASIPQEYEIMEAVGTNSYGKKDYAVSYEINQEEAKQKNIAPGIYLRPEFILGYYDVNKNQIIINTNFYKVLPSDKQEQLFQEVNQKYNNLVEQTWGIKEYKELLTSVNASITDEKEKWKSPLLKEEKWNRNYKNASKEELISLIVNNIGRIPPTEEHPEAYNDYIAIEFIIAEYIKKYSTPKNIKDLIDNIKALDKTTINKKMYMAIGNQINEEIQKHKNNSEKAVTIKTIIDEMKNVDVSITNSEQNYKKIIANAKLYINKHNSLQELCVFFEEIIKNINEIKNVELSVDVIWCIKEKIAEVKEQDKKESTKDKIHSLEEQDIIKKAKQTIDEFYNNKNFNINNLEDLLLLLQKQKKSIETLDKETLRNNYDLYDLLQNSIKKCKNQVEQVTDMNRKFGL